MREPLATLNRKALDTSRSVVVSACAGSGKTWLLVSRIIRLLLSGAAPSQILAITFTRKAAQEMAARLREWLHLLAIADDATVRDFLGERELDPDEIDELLPSARELFERVLIAEPPITITTFHSWFLQLLRSAPLEAGAFGAVTLVDRTAGLLDEAWERLMTSCRRSPETPHARAVEKLFADFGLDNTRRLLRNFVARRAEWWAYTAGCTAPIAAALERYRALLTVEPQADVIGDLLADHAFLADANELGRLLIASGSGRGHGEALLRALAGADRTAAFDAICEAVFTRAGAPRSARASRALAQSAGADAFERFGALQARVQRRATDALAALKEQRSFGINAAAFAAGAALLESFQAVKRERQVVDFADVEWLACALLARSEHAVTVQFRLDSRYRHILLDEFQDTNPLQWLALRAWIDAASAAGDPPALFVVGDPKQSIYRFRRAEPALFDAAIEGVVRQGGTSISQDESFRCAPAVLAVVNRLFAAHPLFAPFNEHASHRASVPGRVEVQPLVRHDPLAAQGGSPGGLRDPLLAALAVPEDVRRATEARLFAQRLDEVVRTWNVVDDPRTGAPRPARFADVMVLVRRRTHLEIYERALRAAGIPYITSRQGGLLDTLEAEDLSALLEFLVSPFDDLKLAQALRSPTFALCDEDLIAIAQAPGRTWWDRLVRLAAGRGSAGIERAVALLERWRERADTQPVHDQLDRIYFEGDVMERYDAAVPAAMRAAVAANLDAFIRHALDTDSGRYPSLPRFIAELRELRSAPLEEAPDEGLLGSSGDSVRILTVHAAKGLEAPIVWVLDAAAPRRPDGGFDALIDWPCGAAAPASLSFWSRIDERSAHQRALCEQEQRRARREDLNLLYVAMTRAKQALIVSGCDTPGWQDSWYMLVRRAVAALTGDDADALSSVIAAGDDLTRPLDDGLAATTAGPAGPDAGDPVPARLPTGSRRSGLQSAGQAYGTAFHRLMERMAADRAPTAERLRRQLRLPRRGFRALWSQARSLLDNPRLSRFFTPALYRRALNEVSIVTAAGELRRLDRVVEFDEDVWVLDYKTGSHAAIAGTALEAEYRAQIAAYCAALQQAYANKPVRGALLFADGSRVDV